MSTIDQVLSDKKEIEVELNVVIKKFEEKHQGVKIDSISVTTTQINGTFGPISTIRNVSLGLKIGE